MGHYAGQRGLFSESSHMPSLNWSQELALNHAQMDQTHQEFVELLAALETELAVLKPEPLLAYQTLYAHTVEHFAREDEWMLATGFAPENCHSNQHKTVLDVMEQVLMHLRDKADIEPLKVLVPELVQWFPSHAQMMDAALAWHLEQVGFDMQTGKMSNPPEHMQAISSCASQSCTT